MKYDKIINIHTITMISPSVGVSGGNAGVVVVIIAIAPHVEAEERWETTATQAE